MSIMMGFMYYFEGVTTWYQSVPGSNTLGTWEVISITMGLSRLIRDLDVVSHAYLITCLCACLGMGFNF